MLEVLGLVATLVGGAVLRYWLSTVVPFDAAEEAFLADAADPDRAMRVPFIMMNGVSLFALYLMVRRSFGVLPAFAALLSLQSSLTFQYEALRVRLWPPAVLLVLIAIAWFLPRVPKGSLPRRAELALGALALVLAGRELFLLATLPSRLARVRRASAADVTALRASVMACGDPTGLPLERLRACDLAWPRSRSLDQQEALWDHQRRLGEGALGIATRAAIPTDGTGRIALFDERGAGFIVVMDGPARETARRVLGSAGP